MDLNNSSISLSSFLSQVVSEDENVLLTWLKKLQNGETMEVLEHGFSNREAYYSISSKQKNPFLLFHRDKSSQVL